MNQKNNKISFLLASCLLFLAMLCPTAIALANTTSYTFSLTPKWNLISFPIFPSNTTVKNESIFQALIQTGKFFEVWLWANKDNVPYAKWSDHWFAWAYNDPESNFSDLNQAKSYFIKVNEPVSFSVSGVVNNFTFQSWLDSADLKAGWNMTGFPFESSAPVATALKSIEQQYTKVAYWDKTANEYKYFYNPSMGVPEYLNDFTQFEPGIGYWVRISNGYYDRESIFDRKIHIESSLITNFSAPRLCDSMRIQKQYIDVGGCKLYSEIEGNGIPVVLINGGPGGTHHVFHPYFSQAANFAKVIYYDQRGTGLSEYNKGSGYTVDQAVNDLENLRKELKIGKWVVVGWSYGGLLAQSYLLKYPQNTAGLVLIGSSSGMPNVSLLPTRQSNYLSQEEKNRINAVIQEVGNLYTNGTISFNRYNELIVYNRQINGDWKRQDYYKPTTERMAQKALYEWNFDFYFRSQIASDMNKINLQGAFQTSTTPTIIFEGTWDLTWNTDKPEILHNNHPNSELVMFPASGHGIFMDETDSFFDTLKKFIDRLPPAGNAYWN